MAILQHYDGSSGSSPEILLKYNFGRRLESESQNEMLAANRRSDDCDAC